jgi:hypothetical protein
MDADACTPAPLPLDSREGQCARAADFMEAHPGCTLRDLTAGADLGSASKVISEMPRFGYTVRKQRARVPCADGEHSRPVKRYYLEARPQASQFDLFPI